jgi:hypothetical protein
LPANLGINNLHPNKFPDIYRTIEKLVEASLPLWDQRLAMVMGDDGKIGAGRIWPRRASPDDLEQVLPTLIPRPTQLTRRSDD